MPGIYGMIPDRGPVRSAPTRPARPSTAYGPTTGISGGALGNTPLPVAKPAPTATQTSYVNGSPGPVTYSAPVSYGGGGSDVAPAPAIDPNTDYLNDPGYIAQISALDKAMQDYTSQDTANWDRYNVDYNKGLNDLGYQDMDPTDAVNMDWNWDDLLTASGRGRQNTVNNFAGRGTIQSSAYFDALDQLTRSLDDQRNAMGTARQDYKNSQSAAKTTYASQDAAARATAMADAIAKLSAAQALG